MNAKPWTKKDYLDWARATAALDMGNAGANVEQIKRFDPEAAALVHANNVAVLKVIDHVKSRLEKVI